MGNVSPSWGTQTHALTDEQYAAIGRVVVASGYLETGISEAFIALLKLDSLSGAVLTRNMTSAALKNLLKLLANKILTPDQFEEYTQIHSEIGEALDERHKTAHHEW